MAKRTVRIQRLMDSAILPRYAHPGDSGMDLCAAESAVLNVGERKLIRTGLVVEIPTSMEAQIRPRSGLALHHGITVLNAPGTIDSEYRGELNVLLINHGNLAFGIDPGMRIAQLVFARVTRVEFEEVFEVSVSSRGTGGFGSTGR